MKLIGRRNFVSGLGLGSAATLLTPFCKRAVGDALGQSTVNRRVLFVTQGNAWNHGGDTKLAMGATNTGEKSAMFRAVFRSPQDFDLPVFMADTFAPFKNELAIWFGLKGHNTTPANHGSDSNTLNGMPEKQSDISIDRLIGRELKKRYQDVHDSTTMGPILKSYGGKNCGAPSWDGPGMKAPSYMTPVTAYAAYFGAAMGITPQQMQINNDLDKSLFDGIREDLARSKKRLAGSEAAKLDQIATSLREFETKLTNLRSSPKLTGKPTAPTIDKTGMDKTIVRAFSDLTVQVQAFNLTHVSHLSLHGGAAFDDDNWKPLAGDDFNNYGENHNRLFHTETDASSDEIRKMHRFTAPEIAYIRSALSGFRVGSGSLYDETVIVWTVQGGLRHHNGSPAQTIVLLAGPRTRVKTPLWSDYLTVGSGFNLAGSKDIGQAYVTLANALDIPIASFAAGQGGLPELLRS